MIKKNIIIDCDPGIDDAIALTLAMANMDKLNIMGITTVAGNQSIDKVTNNTLKLVSYLKKDIRVAKGSNMPIIRQKKDAGDVHGPTGFGYFKLPETDKKLVDMNAVEFIKNIVINSKEKVTIVPIGPLTNIALVLKVYPEIKDNVENIVLMGGGIKNGNVTPTAEFNIWADPEAAYIVFNSGVSIVMNGLDVTDYTGFSRKQVDNLMKSNSRVSNMCGNILDFYFEGDHLEDKSFTPIHDASAIMYLLYPEIYEYKYMKVDIDISEGFNRGMTVGDMRTWKKYDSSYTKVLIKTDKDKFSKLLLESIKKLDEEFE